VPLPYWPVELSNGEFVPRDPRPSELAVIDEMRVRADRAAARTGMDRRRFLGQAGGMAVVLGVLNGCASSGGTASPVASTSTSTTTTSTTTPSPPTTGGRYDVPADPEDEEACESILGDQGEFIFDVHTHHVMPDGVWRDNAPRIEAMIDRLVPAGCLAADRLECLDRIAYINDLFLASDTTVSLLSDVPNSGDADAPVPFDAKVGTAQFAESLAAGGQPRVLVQDVIAPNFGSLDARLDLMAATHATGHVASFKVYTAWGPDQQGYALDDPGIGLPVLEQARSLGVDIIAAHKGLPLLEFDRRFNGPRDVVSAAAQYPDVRFIVYHAAFERETYEGPYDPDAADTGINSLIRAMDDLGLPPGSNVYCELGTTWRETMRDPTQAAHALGKLLTRMGEDRVLWGTDGIWLGTPQAQIMAFRTFAITEAFQEQYGYPALTDELKRKVFGLNAAGLFGLDAEATRCAVDATALYAARLEADELVGAGAAPSPHRTRGYATRREVLTWLRGPDRPTAPF